jgi:hypothetical protein
MSTPVEAPDIMAVSVETSILNVVPVEVATLEVR